MDASLLQTLWTAVSFAVFAGIVYWAWSRGTAPRFAEAERMPFADEEPPDAGRDEGGRLR